MGDDITLEPEGGEVGGGTANGGVPEGKMGLRIMFLQALADEGTVGV